MVIKVKSKSMYRLKGVGLDLCGFATCKYDWGSRVRGRSEREVCCKYGESALDGLSYTGTYSMCSR